MIGTVKVDESFRFQSQLWKETSCSTNISKSVHMLSYDEFSLHAGNFSSLQSRHAKIKTVCEFRYSTRVHDIEIRITVILFWTKTEILSCSSRYFPIHLSLCPRQIV